MNHQNNTNKHPKAQDENMVDEWNRAVRSSATVDWRFDTDDSWGKRPLPNQSRSLRGDLDGLDASDIQDIFADLPSSELPRSEREGAGFSVVDLRADAGLAQSKGDARCTIQGGSVYLNSQRVEDAGQMVTINDAFEGQFLVLRKGRKKFHPVKLLS